MIVEEFRKSILKYLKSKGLSLDDSEPAYKAGYSISELKRLVLRGTPTVATLGRLAQSWGVSTDDLICGPMDIYNGYRPFHRYPNIGRRFNEIAQRRRYNFSELAAKLFISKDSMQQMLGRHNHRLNTVDNFAKALNCEPRELLA